MSETTAPDYPTIALENMQEMELKRGLVAAELDACEAELRELYGTSSGVAHHRRGHFALEAVLGDEEAGAELRAQSQRGLPQGTRISVPGCHSLCGRTLGGSQADVAARTSGGSPAARASRPQENRKWASYTQAYQEASQSRSIEGLLGRGLMERAFSSEAEAAG